MGRIIAVYGSIGGMIVAVGMLIAITFVSTHDSLAMIAGYLNMLIALSMVFVGMKRYRDTVCGGAIRFLPALGVGLGIALVAGLFYVVAWEIYLYATDYTFMDKYIAQSLANMRADGKPAAEIAKFAAEMDGFRAQYSNPLIRMPMTLSEIAPVGIIVAFVSALVLRNSRLFPAKA